MAEPVWFHIDVNSAFLSWTAAYRTLVEGRTPDLREIPSVIANDKNLRTSIVLAKSTPAKKYGVKTGEPLGMARDKCPNLVVAEPDYALYVSSSRRLMALLREVSPVVEQYSIDEAWVDMTGTEGLYGPPVLAAQHLRDRIFSTLGFTVNIGISCNKLLAKMAGELEKPNKVITLFPRELEQKLWHLPVGELFMVGRATSARLTAMGIRTIGDLARADPAFLIRKLGKQGSMIWQFANGKDAGVISSAPAPNKGYSNAVTTPRDVTDFSSADQVLLSLCETVGARLRRDEQAGSCLTVHLRSSSFENWSHQKQLANATNVTQELYHAVRELLRAMWDGKTPLRQLGIQITRLMDTSARQVSLFDAADYEKLSKLDKTVDALREKYGEQALFRAAFLSGDTPNMAGGLSKHRRTGITKPIDEPEQYVLAHLKDGKIKIEGLPYGCGRPVFYFAIFQMIVASSSVIFSMSSTGTYSNLPWKFSPPAQRFGHGSPSNESRAPSVPPRIGCTFGIMPSSSIALFACSTRNMQGSIFSRMLK